MSALPPATPRRGVASRPTATRRLSNASIETMKGTMDGDVRPQVLGAMESDVPKEPVERRCTLWVHEEQFAKDEVIINLDLFPKDSVKPGELMAIVALKTDTGVRDFQDRSPTLKRGSDSTGASQKMDAGSADLKALRDSLDHQHDTDMDRRYLFAVKDMSKEMKAKHPNLEISIGKQIADAFGFKQRSNILLTTTSTAVTTASHVELSFKDEYLARSDMWRLTVSELSNKTVYKGQNIVFMGTIKAKVTSVYVAGRKVQSAFFSINTKPVFRSESARFVLFIQMSREMWDFDSEGTGEIMFAKVVNGFLPALFKRWISQKARHLVSIVLFTRVEYDVGLTNELESDTSESKYYTGVQTDGSRKPYKDFYRVVVSEMASGEWTTILNQLKREFRHFRRDISTHRLNTVVKFPGPEVCEKGMGAVPGTRMEAEPSLAIHGNILEAINLASGQFSQDYIDRDLVRTGISIVLITAGTGLFEVNYQTLRTTTEMLVGSGIGIDLVCLPKIPLHSVPLFRYRNPKFVSFQEGARMKAIDSEISTPRQSGVIFGSFTSTLHGSLSPSKVFSTDSSHRASSLISRKAPDEWSFAIPHWLDVSFWTGASQELKSRPGARLSKEVRRREIIKPFPYFAVRCKMYELEMTSGPEAGTVEISIAPIARDIQLPHQSNTDDLRSEGFTLVKSVKRHSTFIESLHTRIASKPTALEKQVQVCMDSYDDMRAVPPNISQQSLSKTDLRKMVRIAAEKGVKKTLAEDPEVFGTSFNEANENPKGMSLVGAAMSLRKKEPESPEKNKLWKESIGSVKSSATVSTSTQRPSKFSRQISLGNHGFRIAAPKAAVAELQTENANAAKVPSSMAKGQGSSSSVMANHLLSSPRSVDKIDRPSSSQGSFRSTKSSITQTTETKPVDTDKTSSRPITIKSAVTTQETTNTSTTRSMLGSVYERTETNNDGGDLPTLQKLQSSDSLKASKSKLFAGPDLPSTLSPTTALSPWLNVLNPSNPTESDNVASQYKRWQHVFPRPIQTKAMKWKSLCSPASVPLTTEYFPTKLQLDTEYEQNSYTISQNPDDDLAEIPKTREEFLRELISLRLSQGFQIVVGPAVAEAFGQKVLKIRNAFDQEGIAVDGASIFMALGNIIHQLSCVNNTEVEVNMFKRRMGMDPAADKMLATYNPSVRTTLAPEYESRYIQLHRLQEEYNWNTVDSFIAGHNIEMTEGLRFWRARFVLIPVESPNFHHRRKGEDNEEEIRLEGLRTLTQMWQRNRYVPPSERQFQSLGPRTRKDPNPLDIVYRTQDPSMVVSAELETLQMIETGEAYIRRGQLLSQFETFRKANLNMNALAEAIQAPVERGGVRMQNRRWHLRLHYNCFIGSDMTTWLLENFEDVETREEAVELGNLLMTKEDERKFKEKDLKEKERDKEGMFVHVERRHEFRDGQYFYQINENFSKGRPDNRTGWFGSKRRDTSVPSTPMSETGNRDSPRNERVRSSSDEKGSDSGAATPTTTQGKSRPRVPLSKVMKYDVDPRKRSYRPERINLHYDRLHNPDNCFHIRLDWMNVTAKLIEDAIQSWALTAERFGLRLIETPIAEACSITDLHPFRSPYIVELAILPPEKQPAMFVDATVLAPQASKTKNFYQKAILRNFNFVLDVEAASEFPFDIDVTYSWGRPDYKLTQFIHRSGVALAQITDEGHFLLLSNKLYNNRALASREAERFIRADHLDRSRMDGLSRMTPVTATYTGHQQTPLSSPTIRATQLSSPSIRPIMASPSHRATLTSPTVSTSDVLGLPTPGTKYSQMVSPESIKNDLEIFCSDKDALQAFYKEAFDRALPPSATPPSLRNSVPFGASVVGGGANVLDMHIPTLGLPPGILSRDGSNFGVSGSSSPSPMRLSSVPVRKPSQHPSDASSGNGNDSPRFIPLG